MSVLLGLELSGDTITLMAVDRKGTRLSVVQEVVSVPFIEDWKVHPDERVRSVRALLQHSLDEGKIRPGSIAAIGIASTPGLVLVDAEMEPVPPRAIGWSEDEPPIPELHERIPSTLSKFPGLTRSLVAVLDIKDWLRYRWTGALATSSQFAWESGLTPGSRSPERWDPARVDAVGLNSGQLPPVMPGHQRVGILQEEIVRETGLPRGTWFMAGTVPRAARLWMACEPKSGQRIILLEKDNVTAWRVTDAKEDSPDDRNAIPAPLGDHWYVQEKGEIEDPRQGGAVDVSAIYDSAGDAGSGEWAAPAEDIRLSADFGKPSRGPALLAGVGLGWYRDMKPFWRKRCAIQTLAQWMESASSKTSTEDPMSPGLGAPQ
ncbi:MAG: hypothetical protein GWP41_08625 [Planctomycetia bacterium]|nr:hypothetical protein [Planctomycetia bacterium]